VINDQLDNDVDDEETWKLFMKLTYWWY